MMVMSQPPRLREDFDLQRCRPARPLRVLFAISPISYRNSTFAPGQSAGWQPLLGPAYVAGAARAAGHEVALIDLRLEHDPHGALAERLSAFAPDVLAMPCYTFGLAACVETARRAKALRPGLRVVLGGPHVTIFPQECLRDPAVDAAVLGEGELAFCLLLKALAKGGPTTGINGVWSRDCAGRLRRCRRRSLLADLDSLPPPALDLYPLQDCKVMYNVFGRRAVNVMGARGCPYGCSFCASRLTFTRAVRAHSTERVISDLNSLHRLHGFDAFVFYDDLFTFDRARTLELCAALRERGAAPFEWGCCTRSDRVDPELLKAMREAGCRLVMLGVETGSQRLLDRMGKRTTVRRNLAAVKMVKEAGIKVAAGFMIGLPTETPAETLRTIAFARLAAPDFAWFNITEPYPGTDLWEDAVKHGRFVEEDGAPAKDPASSKACWIPEGRTREELRGWLKTAEQP